MKLTGGHLLPLALSGGVLAGLFLAASILERAAPGERPGAAAEGPGRPIRLVSITPAMTEVIGELGALDRLVGVSRHCDWPPGAAGIAKVGDLKPDVETVLALRPDLVLGTTNGLNREAVEKLRDLGVTTSIYPGYTLEDIHALIEHVGREIGEERAGAALSGRIRSAFLRTRRRSETLPRPKVLFIVSHEPLFAATAGSIPDELLRAAGGANVVGERAGEYVQYSVEEAIAARPEVIIDASMAGPGAAGFWSRWKDIPAVRDGRVHSPSADYVYNPGPRIDRGLAEVAAMVHPGTFAAPGPASGEDGR